jgi:hypothetical protein
MLQRERQDLNSVKSHGDIAYHGSHAPNIRAGTPLGPQNNLRRTILPGLNVIGEVMIYPTSIAKICDLDTDDIVGMWVFGLAFLAG